ncbi:hypothetical protein Mp_1g13130 [Marchantia polymorpha subsp. ruderalis]|uniref:Inositol-phosphate phosphatase n=2 Tax=Marchantia polymorpha TaxID=3197 RepID=A0AAF6APM0_MARPO|nr:hypothetical protein MARPO_0019s0083 [Marchantia polymorpha]BBM98390.1 hypothetical protein Mp_1g13130 [Marchantia polymorpha subsp. ruderalis]|eukprot:PTQ44659.1 hypothetical protein MARPO_0019s0083 [Marchantia polymorpha]
MCRTIRSQSVDSSCSFLVCGRREFKQRRGELGHQHPATSKQGSEQQASEQASSEKTPDTKPDGGECAFGLNTQNTNIGGLGVGWWWWWWVRRIEGGEREEEENNFKRLRSEWRRVETSRAQRMMGCHYSGGLVLEGAMRLRTRILPYQFGPCPVSGRGRWKIRLEGTRVPADRCLRASLSPEHRRSVHFEAVATQVETLALKLAKQAGALIREKSGKALQVDTKEVRYDLVTEVDKACERLLKCEVRNVFPEHDWVGEETATELELKKLVTNSLSAPWTWIVDPIDGTLSFVDGVPLSVVSIGIAYRNSMEIGVIYNPYHDELFHARRGQGAFLNGNPIKVLLPETELEDTTVTFGIPSKPDKRVAMLKDVTKVALHCRSLKALGSAALHMSYVAAGRFGCFFENDLKPWDYAAGWLIIEEAGGRVTDLEGKPQTLLGGPILASNGGIIHDRMVELLNLD